MLFCTKTCFRVGNYTVKVFSEKMESVGDFGKQGKFTIFIPVDSAFKVENSSF